MSLGSGGSLIGSLGTVTGTVTGSLGAGTLTGSAAWLGIAGVGSGTAPVTGWTGTLTAGMPAAGTRPVAVTRPRSTWDSCAGDGAWWSDAFSAPRRTMSTMERAPNHAAIA